jgi:hypothetical protein
VNQISTLPGAAMQAHLVSLRAAPADSLYSLWNKLIKSHAAASMLLLWCLWTIATLGHVILSKRLLNESGLSSLEVTVAQLAAGTCVLLLHAAASSWAKQPHPSLQPVLVAAALASHPGCAWLLAALHAAGAWAALYPIRTLAVPLVQSMKASETLMTAAGCVALLGSAYRPNPLQGVMLVGITVGLGVATGASLAGGRRSVVAVALGGSLCVVLRNILSKRFPLEGYALIAWLTVGGLLCVLPLYAVHLATGTNLLGTTVLQGPGALVVLTGVLHWSYNALSCVVLAMVTQPTSHSVMKAAQRLAVVMGAIGYFRQDIR